MSSPYSHEISEQNKELISNAIRKSISDHVASLNDKNVPIYGYCLSTSEELDIVAPCGIANSTSRADFSSLEQYFSPDEWGGDSGEWGNQIFLEDNPLYQELIEEFYTKYKNEDEESYDEYEMAYINCFHEIYVNVLQKLRNEGFFPPEVFLAVWVSDPDDWKMAENAIKKLNSAEVLQGWFNA